jgi:hypothetical protein
MKPYERRKAQAYPYYKLAAWDAVSVCWRDGKPAFPTLRDARASATAPGRYRISQVNESGREDLEPFEININQAQETTRNEVT